jgi:hypothetical protein
MSGRDEHARRAVYTALCEQGCACEPDMIVCGYRDGVPLIETRHDDWCPWLRSREGVGGCSPQVVIFDHVEDEGGEAT